jgi:hypothetical protein
MDTKQKNNCDSSTKNPCMIDTGILYDKQYSTSIYNPRPQIPYILFNFDWITIGFNGLTNRYDTIPTNRFTGTLSIDGASIG